jgi:Arc/MetJ family transcription regulator
VATNLQIDDKLLRRAKKLGGHKTKRETVNRALEEYVRHREQLRLSEMYGTIDFDPSYDYKAQRKRR